MALLESLQFAACVLSRLPVKKPNIYTEAGGEKSENSPRQWKASKSYGNLPFFQGNPEKLHPTTRPCANTGWYWEKTDTHRHLDNQKTSPFATNAGDIYFRNCATNVCREQGQLISLLLYTCINTLDLQVSSQSSVDSSKKIQCHTCGWNPPANELKAWKQLKRTIFGVHNWLALSGEWRNECTS